MFRFNTPGLSATRFKKQSLALLLSAALSAPALADDFSDVYKQFHQAVEAGDLKAAVSLSQQAWKLGEEKFGKDSENAIRLQHSYANMLVESQQFEQAQTIFEQLPERYEDLYGENSKDTFMMYVEILDAAKNLSIAGIDVWDFQSRLSRFLVNHAENVEFGSEENKAQTFHLVSTILGKVGIQERSAFKTEKFLENALALNIQLFGEDSKNAVELRLILSQMQVARGHRSDAITNLELVINQFDSGQPYTHPYVLLSHARLVELYELSGESEKATEHCQAIGQMTPWDDDQKPQPIYRRDPQYPVKYAMGKKNGVVKLSFTIDKQGFVKDIEFIDVQGGNEFGEKARDALAKWRYAPKFVNGEAVEAENNRVQLDFKVI